MSLVEGQEEPLLIKEHLGSDGSQTKSTKMETDQQRAPIIPIALAFIVGVLLSTLFHTSPSIFRSPSIPSPAATTPAEVDSLPSKCPAAESPTVKAPRENIWSNINVDTAVEVRKWLMDPERGLNLTAKVNATESDNWIHIVEARQPAKTAALAYLSDEKATVDKYAHAVIHHGSKDIIVDYLIGPLPISPSTTISPITDQYSNPIPLNAHATFNWDRLAAQFGHLILPLEPVLKDLFNASLSDGKIAPAGVAPMSYDGKWRRTWVQLRRNGPGSWLQGLDFYLYVDMSGTDPNLFHILQLVHDRHLYQSVDEILGAWKNGTLVKADIPENSDWATRKMQGAARDMDDKPGPRSFVSAGQRYRVDRDEQYVTWMGWSFYLSFERNMGLHLWDINILGERIIYELSPQEAMAQYSGSDPHQGSTVWLDGAFGMGSSVRDVILGYDCPTDSTLLNATVHEGGSTVRHNAICIFERESGRPISRHTGSEKNEMGAIKGYELVVRSISTVGNYDYLFDYTFQLDGTIEIRVSASGYLQGGLWQPEQDPYGHRIHQTALGSLHDHVINYKVDFDIAGVKNSFLKASLEMEEKALPWFDGDWGSITRQQRIKRELLSTESLLDYPHNMEGAYVVTNEDKTNAWGNPRGYTIHPGPLCHLTNLDSKRTEHNINWAKHHLAVSQRKDEEHTSTSMWNINLPGAPPVNFYDFFDDESISQEDLVVWLNLGTHHIPRAEDTPNTLTNLATSYVLLAPYNYFDRDISMDSRNSVILNKDGDWVIEESIQAETCIPPAVDPLRYRSMEGWDELGRKEGDVDAWGHLNKIVPG